MRPVTVRFSGTGPSPATILSTEISPFQVSVGVRVITGPVSYTLEYTYDDPRGPGGLQNWLVHAPMVDKTASADAVSTPGL